MAHEFFEFSDNDGASDLLGHNEKADVWTDGMALLVIDNFTMNAADRSLDRQLTGTYCR